MKKTWIISLLVLALALPMMASASVETSVGAMQVGGKVKVVWNWVGESEKTGVPEYNSIYTSWAELDFTGMVGENVHYTIELMYGGPFVDSAGVSNQSWFSNIGIRQAYISIVDLIPMTTLVMGTFIPPISNYGPRSFTDLDMINYPLMNDGRNLLYTKPMAQGNNVVNLVGIRPAWDFSMWQQTGLIIIIKPMDMIEFQWGIINGAASGVANHQQQVINGVWNDDFGYYSDFTDPMFANAFKLAFMSGDFTGTVAYYFEPFMTDLNWDKNAEEYKDGDGYQQRRELTVWTIYVSYITDQIDFTADWVYMSIPDFQYVPDGNNWDEENWSAMGWQVTIGYWFTDTFEGLVRIENQDPNLANDEAWAVRANTGNFFYKPGFDQDTWYTFGVNARINDNAEVSVNYIHKQEQGRTIDLDDGEVGGKYQKQNNDEVLVQVQVWQ